MTRDQTILVVDDQDIVRDVMKLGLERAGYRVLATGSPLKAIAIAAQEVDIALLLTDVVLPEMDAFELAGRIAQEIPGIQVLYTSGYTNARSEGAFLQKPFTPTELVAVVDGLLLAPV